MRTIPEKNLRPVDIATVIYLLVLSIIMLFFHNGLRGWAWYVLAHVVTVGLIFLLVRAGENISAKPIVFLRHWYPALLAYPLFAEMNNLINIIFPFWANDWLIKADLFLFGAYPTVWFEKVATPALNELMVFFYLFYFLLIPLAGLPLYLRGRWEEFHGLMFCTMLAYYVSYIAFLFFPAESPRVILAHLQSAPLSGGHLLGLLNRLQDFGGIHGGAFPSSHVAAAFAILLSAYRYEREIFYLLLIPVIGLAVSTTYCRYHYGVDALGGALLGMVCYAIGQKLYSSYQWAKRSLSVCGNVSRRPSILPDSRLEELVEPLRK